MATSYIAALEDQQLSFLKAVRDLQYRYPNDSKVHILLQQLQASGFDTDPLPPSVHLSEGSKEEDKIPSWTITTAETPSSFSNSSSDELNFTVDFIQLSSMLDQNNAMETQVMSDIIRGYDGVRMVPTLQRKSQTDLSFPAQQDLQSYRERPTIFFSLDNP